LEAGERECGVGVNGGGGGVVGGGFAPEVGGGWGADCEGSGEGHAGIWAAGIWVVVVGDVDGWGCAGSRVDGGGMVTEQKPWRDLGIMWCELCSDMFYGTVLSLWERVGEETMFVWPCWCTAHLFFAGVSKLGKSSQQKITDKLWGKRPAGA